MYAFLTISLNRYGSSNFINGILRSPTRSIAPYISPSFFSLEVARVPPNLGLEISFIFSFLNLLTKSIKVSKLKGVNSQSFHMSQYKSYNSSSFSWIEISLKMELVRKLLSSSSSQY